MATPIGHYLLGVSIAHALGGYGVSRRQSLLLGAVAVVPDLDVLPGILMGELGRFHHAASHSLTSAVVFALISLLVLTRWKPGRLSRFFSLVLLIYGSHLLLDFFTLDTGAPVGIPLLWPWASDTFQAPWVLLPNVQHTSGALISAHNFLLAGRELLIFLPLALLVDDVRAQGLPRGRMAPRLYGSWFLAALGASLVSLRQHW